MSCTKAVNLPVTSSFDIYTAFSMVYGVWHPIDDVISIFGCGYTFNPTNMPLEYKRHSLTQNTLKWKTYTHVHPHQHTKHTQKKTFSPTQKSQSHWNTKHIVTIVENKLSVMKNLQNTLTLIQSTILLTCKTYSHQNIKHTLSDIQNTLTKGKHTDRHRKHS